METGTVFNWCVKAFNGKKPSIHDAIVIPSDRNRESIKIPQLSFYLRQPLVRIHEMAREIKENVKTRKKSPAQ